MSMAAAIAAKPAAIEAQAGFGLGLAELAGSKRASRRISLTERLG